MDLTQSELVDDNLASRAEYARAGAERQHGASHMAKIAHRRAKSCTKRHRHEQAGRDFFLFWDWISQHFALFFWNYPSFRFFSWELIKYFAPLKLNYL